MATQPAKVEDKLVATKISYSIITRAFAASKNADLLKISRAPQGSANSVDAQSR
jgi:hypothetical protein